MKEEELEEGKKESGREKEGKGMGEAERKRRKGKEFFC